jgi:hypothetical protein
MFNRLNPMQALRRTRSEGCKRQQGQSLLELALVTPLLLLLMVGVFEVGWAIRGYLVVVNANREATRFSARGRYLDFSNTDPTSVGYSYVLSHTMASISQQVPLDVTSADPNGTLIVSHFLVDTREPCQDPPCASSATDCRDPNLREADNPYDDLVLHAAVPGYGHFQATYGTPRESRIDPEEFVTKLKAENDAFNCTQNLGDATVPWGINSVIVVETIYEQPQLLGLPLISNHFTDPLPLYTHTVMRISGDSRGDITASHGSGCELFPIAVHEDTLNGLQVGQATGNIRNGTSSGNFGWLRWTDDTDAVNANANSAEYLAEEMNNMRLSFNDYTEPITQDPDDTVINAGDWVWGLTGNVNSNAVRDAMDARLGQTLLFPVWDTTVGSGSNTKYHIVKFALIRLDGYNLTGNPKEVWGTFQGWDPDTCTGNGH